MTSSGGLELLTGTTPRCQQSKNNINNLLRLEGPSHGVNVLPSAVKEYQQAPSITNKVLHHLLRNRCGVNHAIMVSDQIMQVSVCKRFSALRNSSVDIQI
jgi:hypothetical protein